MNNTEKDSHYLPYGDAIRVVAIFTVIALHSAAARLFHFNEIHRFEWWTANIVDSLSRWAVPVFIMLSGALNLDLAKEYTLSAFYKRRMTRIITPLVFWSIFYFLYSKYYYEQSVTWHDVFESLYSGMGNSPLYFLFVIMGLYAVTPALRPFIQKCPKYLQWLCTGVILAAAGTDIIYTVMPLNAFTRFIPFTAYYLLGHLIGEIPVNRRRMFLSVAVYALVSAFIIVATRQLFTIYEQTDYRVETYYNYVHPVVVIQSISIYIVLRHLFTQWDKKPSGRIFHVLAPVSFGIYLTHQVSLDIVRAYAHTLDNYQGIFFDIALESVGAFAISSIMCLVFLRIPGLRRIIA